MTRSHDSMESRFSDNVLFCGSPPSLLAAISPEIAISEFEEGALIFNEGDNGDSLFLVAEGSVRISKLGRAGKQETLGYIEAGDYFGEMALLDSQPRSAQAMANKKCVLGRISKQGFLRILEHAPADFFMSFLRVVVRRLRDVNSHFISELLRTERLSLIGTMASSIIHDFKNPMGIVLLAADFIAIQAPTPECLESTALIKKAIFRMRGMTQELLDFASGNTELRLERHSVDSLLEELQDAALAQLPDTIEVRKEISYSGPLVIDQGRFVRVLANLVKNAGEAMPNGGAITIKVDSRDNEILFVVADNGSGIPPEILNKVFEPFVTHGKSNGTGLGMAIVKSIVEAHKGKISLQSTVGQGTTVEICLPVGGLP